MRNSLLLCTLIVFTTSVRAFVQRPTTSLILRHQATTATSQTILHAKKKKGRGGKGFGKETEPEPVNTRAFDDRVPEIPPGDASLLKSVEGGSSAIPRVAETQVPDESVPVEERTAQILRDQYGLRTREEQQEEFRKNEAMKKQRKKLEKWKKMADEGEDFDLMQALPEPVLIFIDRFLKAGVAICAVLFVSAGIAITVEAWSKTSDTPLPTDVDAFITNTIEPNFTPGLLVLLGFSVSLGVFSAAQLSSASSAYRQGGEKDR